MDISDRVNNICGSLSGSGREPQIFQRVYFIMLYTDTTFLLENKTV